MAEILNEIVNDAPHSVLANRNERSAMQPQIDVDEDEQILDGKADFIFV